MLERFRSNRVGDAPGRFPTSEHRGNLVLTVFVVVDSIPNVSEAPPAVDSAESCCSRSVGHLNGSTSGPRRPSRPGPSHYSRPPFATTAASTALANALEHPLDVSGAFSLLFPSPAPVRQPPSPPPAHHQPRATTSFNGTTRRRKAVGKRLGGVHGTHPGS